MGRVQKTHWTCDGTCGTQVTTEDGVLPPGWVTVVLGHSIQSEESGMMFGTIERTFHALGPCLFDWGGAQMGQFVLDGANFGTGLSTPGPVPQIEVDPTVTGTVAVGQTVTGGNGTWENSPTFFIYEWKTCATVNGTFEEVAEGETYVIQAADEGKYLRLYVTAINASGAADAYSDSALVAA